VTPEAIFIFTIIMVIFSWINNKSDLAGANRTACLECGGLEFGDILPHKVINGLTGASFGCPQNLGESFGASWLMEMRLTLWIRISITLCKLLRVTDIHSISITVV
jgi:hypothetical protein